MGTKPKRYKWELHYKYDKTYWWQIGRNELSAMLLNEYLSGIKNKKILDVGCGSGVLLQKLKESGADARGVEVSKEAIGFCKRLGLDVRKGEALALPFKGWSFDAVCLVDVLEHIKKEEKVISEAKRVLKKSGVLMIISPAFEFLRSSRDTRLGHVRRYTKEDLNILLRKDFKVEKSSYFVFFFFLPFWAWVMREKLFEAKDIKTDLLLVRGFLSSIFLLLLRFENFLLKFVNLPFGVSVFAVARKK